MARVALRTQEECLEAWRYIRPYAVGIADDKKALIRLQGGPSLALMNPIHLLDSVIFTAYALPRRASIFQQWISQRHLQQGFVWA